MRIFLFERPEKNYLRMKVDPEVARRMGEAGLAPVRDGHGNIVQNQ